MSLLKGFHFSFAVFYIMVDFERVN